MRRPFSAKEFSRLISLLECKSSTLVAIWTPLTLTHGPLPIRVRDASTAVASGLQAEIGVPGLGAGADLGCQILAVVRAICAMRISVNSDR